MGVIITTKHFQKRRKKHDELVTDKRRKSDELVYNENR
jgi:hypothetical protein